MKRRVLFRCFYQSGTFGYVQYGHCLLYTSSDHATFRVEGEEPAGSYIAGKIDYSALEETYRLDPVSYTHLRSAGAIWNHATYVCLPHASAPH